MSFIASRKQIVKLSSLAAVIADISTACQPGKVKFSPKNPRPDTTTLGTEATRNNGVLGVRDATLTVGGLLKLTSVSAAPVMGRKTVLVIDQYPLKSFVQTGSVKRSRVLSTTNCLNDAYAKRGVLGLQSSKVTFAGLYDSVASGIDARFRAMGASETASLLTIGPNGLAVGYPVDLVQVVEDSFDVGGDQGGVVPISGSFMNDDLMDAGRSLHDLTAETAIMTGTAVDCSAASSFGWVAHLHVTALSGFTSLTFKLEDSADGAAWADVSGGAFTSITALGAQRLEGSATATIRRHRRISISAVVGTGSVTFTAAIASRGYTDATYAPAGTHLHLAGLLDIATAPTFQFGPEGGASGNNRFTGSVRLQDYSWDFKNTDVISWSATLPIDGQWTEDTF